MPASPGVLIINRCFEFRNFHILKWSMWIESESDWPSRVEIIGSLVVLSWGMAIWFEKSSYKFTTLTSFAAFWRQSNWLVWLSWDIYIKDVIKLYLILFNLLRKLCFLTSIVHLVFPGSVVISQPFGCYIWAMFKNLLYFKKTGLLSILQSNEDLNLSSFTSHLTCVYRSGLNLLIF